MRNFFSFRRVIPVVLTVAVFYIAKESLMNVLLQSIDMGSSIGTFLLLLFAFIVACIGILALSSLSFTKYINKKPGFIETIRALMRVGLLLFGFILVFAILMGILSILLQGIIGKTESTKKVIDFITMIIAILVVPVWIHIFLQAGLNGKRPIESISKLKESYLLLLVVTAAIFLLGHLLDFLNVFYWLSLILMFLVTVSIILFLLWKYTKPNETGST